MSDELREILADLEPFIEVLPDPGKKIIRGAGLDVSTILGCLEAVKGQEFESSKQAAILLYWARCLRREVPVI